MIIYHPPGNSKSRNKYREQPNAKYIDKNIVVDKDIFMLSFAVAVINHSLESTNLSANLSYSTTCHHAENFKMQ